MTTLAWMDPDGMTLRVAIMNIDGNWIVASLNLRVGDWAAYSGAGNPRDVAATGDKVSEEEARAAFPKLSAGFVWRP